MFTMNYKYVNACTVPVFQSVLDYMYICVYIEVYVQSWMGLV